jgi:hypothetical protein
VKAKSSIVFRQGMSYPRLGRRLPKFCVTCMKMLISTGSIYVGHRGHDVRGIRKIVFA